MYPLLPLNQYSMYANPLAHGDLGQFLYQHDPEKHSYRMVPDPKHNVSRTEAPKVFNITQAVSAHREMSIS